MRATFIYTCPSLFATPTTIPKQEPYNELIWEIARISYSEIELLFHDAIFNLIKTEPSVDLPNRSQ
jgi:hypothetical protein